MAAIHQSLRRYEVFGKCPFMLLAPENVRESVEIPLPATMQLLTICSSLISRTGHFQSCISGSTSSSILSSPSGDPQGSVLSPTLFTTYMSHPLLQSSHGVKQHNIRWRCTAFSLHFPCLSNSLSGSLCGLQQCVSCMPSQLVPPQWNSSESN